MLIQKYFVGLTLIILLQSCGVTYSGIGGMSGSSSGSSSSGGMSGSSSGSSSSGGMSGSSGGIRGMDGQGSGNQQNGSRNYPSETNAEKQARLEGDLERSVGGLDEVLGQEQREIDSVGRNTEGFGGDSRNGGGVGLGKQSSGGSQRGGEGDISNSNANPKASSVGQLSQEEIEARTPDDIPDLISEDIVAKQLREAALTEGDAKLRERLWEEYRNYNRL
jgi:hypothetical protein